MAAGFEDRGQAVEGLAPHDHRAAHGELLEAAKVGGQVPRHLATGADHASGRAGEDRSEAHTSELQSLMPNSVAVFCVTKKQTQLPKKYHCYQRHHVTTT